LLSKLNVNKAICSLPNNYDRPQI